MAEKTVKRCSKISNITLILISRNVFYFRFFEDLLEDLTGTDFSDYLETPEPCSEFNSKLCLVRCVKSSLKF